MFSLSKTAGRNAAAIPRHLTTLSVSWLNTQVKAVAVQRGQVTGTWEPPASEADAAADFEAILRQAVKETGYRGQTVSLVLAHPRLVQHMVDVPSVKGAALNKVIQRQAAQQKFFSGEAAYASQMLASAKNSRRVLLHLFPRLTLNQFMVACRRNDLHLVSVLPASAALQQQLPALALQRADVVMLAAETGGATTLVICDGDGRLLLARTLQGTWNEDPAKLALDLNRTVLFVSQQFNVTLTAACISSASAPRNKRRRFNARSSSRSASAPWRTSRSIGPPRASKCGPRPPQISRARSCRPRPSAASLPRSWPSPPCCCSPRPSP